MPEEKSPEVRVVMPDPYPDPDENWAICCSNSSSHFIKYMVQVVVSLTILTFAIVMIATGHTDPVWWSLLTLVIGIFVPTPSLSKGKV
jgi:hypothetical protein